MLLFCFCFKWSNHLIIPCNLAFNYFYRKQKFLCSIIYCFSSHPLNRNLFAIYFFLSFYIRFELFTWSERRPAVGVWSVGSDSGISPNGSVEWSPGHPTHNPLPFITTGATAVTKPPALKKRKGKKKRDSLLNRVHNEHLFVFGFP